MDLLAWIAIFAVSSLFWAWIVWGGPDWLEGSFLSALLLCYRAPEWPSEGIKLFAAGTWFCHAVWFVVGVVSPALRFWP
nr:MetaGeneMark_Unknown Function [uncultured bacterium]